VTGPPSEPLRGGTNGWAIAAFVLGILGVLTLPDATTYPGEESLSARGDECGPTFFDYAPNSPE
jgi:hypothetical protein